MRYSVEIGFQNSAYNYGKNYISDFGDTRMVIYLVSFDKLSGKPVICAGGFDLGEINGFEMNTDTWQVTHLHVRLSNKASEDLGFKTRFVSKTVCLPTSLVAKVGDNILLNKSLDELTKHPEINECRE